MTPISVVYHRMAGESKRIFRRIMVYMDLGKDEIDEGKGVDALAEELWEHSEQLKRIKFYFDLQQRTAEGYPFVTDLHTGIVMISDRMVKEYELPGNVLVDFDRYWMPLIYSEDVADYENGFKHIFDPGHSGEHNIEYRVRNRKGEYTWVHCHGIVGRDESGEAVMFAGSIMKMDRILHADPVTGLLNRYAFDQAVRDGVSSAVSKGEMGAVMIIGLDNFHLLNEAYETHFDDVAMRQIGQSITNVLPTHLNLYKLDGYEFGLIWPHTSQEEVQIIFSSIQLCLREAKESNDKVFFSASAGAVFYPDSGTDALALQKHAQAALEMAQQQGREQLLVFSRESYEEWLRFINLQRAFEESIEKGCKGFKLFYQPQVDAITQELIGAEALLRWQEDDGHVISPLVFIPILERTRLIIPVGRWIVEEAVRTCKKWQEYWPGFQMSINVSLCQLESPALREHVKESLERHGLPAKYLTLELTESQQVSNSQFVNEQFDYFRQMGVKVAMDDFGMGYSSLALLKTFSCDVVKIDKVFVDNVMDSQFDKNLVKYAIKLCRSIGMAVCVEGVEDKESYEYLAHECGADVIQGFYFGRPEPEMIFQERFRKN